MASNLKAFVCNRTVKHDKKRYETDAPIELTDDQAEPLIACGAISPKKKANKDNPAES